MNKFKFGIIALALIALTGVANAGGVGYIDYAKVIVSIVAGYGVFKMGYINLKNYYKSHLHEIDAQLPYYLKSLEILIQHDTVPVAIGKSLEDAPKIFQEGLKELLQKINAGDSSITP